MTGAGSAAGAKASGTKRAAADGASETASRARRLGGSMPRSRSHRRTWLAFKPLASATPATDTPGSLQAEMTDCLNASLCVRGRGMTTSMVSTIEVGGHYLQRTTE